MQKVEKPKVSQPFFHCIMELLKVNTCMPTFTSQNLYSFSFWLVFLLIVFHSITCTQIQGQFCVRKYYRQVYLPLTFGEIFCIATLAVNFILSFYHFMLLGCPSRRASHNNFANRIPTVFFTFIN